MRVWYICTCIGMCVHGYVPAQVCVCMGLCGVRRLERGADRHCQVEVGLVSLTAKLGVETMAWEVGRRWRF